MNREQTQRFNNIIIDFNKNDTNNDFYELSKVKILFHNEEFLIVNKP